MPGPATAAGANGGNRGTPISVPAASGSSTAMRPGASLPPRTLPPLGPPATGRSSLGRRMAMGVGALVLVGAAVVALIVITNSGGGTAAKSSSTPKTTNAPAASRAAAFSPSSVTVAVLNGTTTNQLAHRVATKLAGVGYREGRIQTAANQTETTTVVGYLPGAKNRTAALHVATALNLRPTAVKPIDPGTQQVACPPPTACTANVVVTVGADLATLQ